MLMSRYLFYDWFAIPQITARCAESCLPKPGV